jgi:hypothetical protein
MRNGMKDLCIVARCALLVAALGGGCLSSPAGKIDVPSDLLRGRNDGANNSRGRYILRVTDGDRDWELSIPEIATAYEVRVPLRGGKGDVGGGIGVEQPLITAADKEIVGQREIDARVRAEEPRADPATAAAGREGDGDGDASGGDAGGGGTSPKPARPRAPAPGATTMTGAAAAPRASYLLTLAKVKDLYRTRNYEIALVELVALEHQYPDDERIMSMKGSLYEKLGRRQLARDAWEAVLALNPYNLQVAEALQRLGK